MKKKVDILNLEWESNGRDANIIEPVLVALEDRYGYSIVRSSIWYGVIKLLYYRPKVLLMSNQMGAINNYTIFYIAHKLGIITIALISEGMPVRSRKDKEKNVANIFFWGCSPSHKRIWDLKLLWSASSRQIFFKHIQGIENYNVRVSGGTGFDRYSLFKYDSSKIKKQMGDKLNQYKRIVLMLGYGFDKIMERKYDESFILTKEEWEWVCQQRIGVGAVYEEVIRNNPEVLFVIKQHPGSLASKNTEFENIVHNYENVIEIGGTSREKNFEVGKALCIADIVIAYDSTACLEAWLMGKTTILVNPVEKDYPRTSLYKGSPNAKTAKELNDYIGEYYNTGSVKDFEERLEQRRRCIEEYIQFDDGLNYLRASKLIDEQIKLSNKKANTMNHEDKKMLANEFFSEVKEWIIANTFMGLFRKNSQKAYIRRQEGYNKEIRNGLTKKFRNAINQYEVGREQEIEKILANYDGLTNVDKEENT